MEKCSIIIPIYKSELSGLELCSFIRGVEIFKEYPMIIVTHKNLNLSFYYEISCKFRVKFIIEYFDEEYFMSVSGYNKLTFSKSFYQRFTNYEYILIYQTDAYVFRDELQQWCSKGYDYIGAPIFQRLNKNEFSTKVEGVGNGGFCLRKPAYCLKILNYPSFLPYLTPKGLYKMKKLYYQRNDIKHSIINDILLCISFVLGIFGVRNNVNYYIKSGKLNEDYLYSIYANLSWIKVSLPKFDEALKFSFEKHPKLLYDLNDKKLPFGCHAFEKNNYNDFWKNIIKYE